MLAYLDYLSASPIDPRVLDVMQPIMRECWGNSLSLHEKGTEAAKTLQQAREQVAAFIGAHPEEIIFTSGELEANNMAVKGLLTVHENGQLLASAVEPLSIIKAAESLEKWGYSTSLIPVNHHGQVNLAVLDKLLNRFARLASVSWVVGETGAMQPVEEIAAQVHASGVLFHCDASHAAPLFPLDVKAMGIDALTICSEPIAGPSAVGALYLREGIRFQPLFEGGAQEGGRRPGRENLAGIVGFAKASELQTTERQTRFKYIKELDSHMKSRLREIPDLSIHSDLPSRAPGVISCHIEGLEAEAVLVSLNNAGICASVGSPCAALGNKASHVLKAMGFTDEQASSTLNISFSWNTNKDEINDMMEVLKTTVTRLKAMSY